jgi:hypothetical protein
MTPTHDERERGRARIDRKFDDEWSLLFMIMARLDRVIDLMETPRPECRIETGNIIPFPSPDPA